MIPVPIYVRVMGNLFNGMIAGEPGLSISTGTRLTCMSGAGRPILPVLKQWRASAKLEPYPSWPSWHQVYLIGLSIFHGSSQLTLLYLRCIEVVVHSSFCALLSFEWYASPKPRKAKRSHHKGRDLNSEQNGIKTLYPVIRSLLFIKFLQIAKQNWNHRSPRMYLYR